MATQEDITTPLIRAQNVQAPNLQGLDLLAYLIGTWNSSASAPVGFNVMPLPQAGGSGFLEPGYVMKNMIYYEEVTMGPIAGGAPNRAGLFQQNSSVLFYEQRVFIANTPAGPGYVGTPASVVDTLVHAENGSWLSHAIVNQPDGAYGPGTIPVAVLPKQPASMQYNKQISVPHGNSVLMVGAGSNWQRGNPVYDRPYPTLLPFSAFHTLPDPNQTLQNGLPGGVQAWARLRLSTLVPGGGVQNILFEQQNAAVTQMDTDWYILWLGGNSYALQYAQYITLWFSGNSFIHTTANTLTAVSGQLGSLPSPNC